MIDKALLGEVYLVISLTNILIWDVKDFSHADGVSTVVWNEECPRFHSGDMLSMMWQEKLLLGEKLKHSSICLN